MSRSLLPWSQKPRKPRNAPGRRPGDTRLHFKDPSSGEVVFLLRLREVREGRFWGVLAGSQRCLAMGGCLPRCDRSDGIGEV